MKKHILTLTLLIFANICIGQIKAVTEKGDTIFVFENGTWKNELVKKFSTIESISAKANVKVDDFSGDKSISTEIWSSFGVNSTKARLSGNASYYKDGIYSISLTISSNLGCMSQQRSTLKVKLSNGEVVEFIQVSKTDCGSTVVASFIPIMESEIKNENLKLLIEENVELLKEYDWVSMRIQGTEYYTDITPRKTKKIEKPEQFFRQHLTAISNEL